MRVRLPVAAVLCALFQPSLAQTVTSFDPHGGREAAFQIEGSGFTGTTGVRIGAGPVASFNVVSDTRIEAVAPAAFATGPVEVETGSGMASSDFSFISRSGAVDLVGPTGRSSLPLGVSFNYAPLDDNAFGQASGLTYTYQGMPLTSRTWVYYGIRDGVGISMDNDLPSGSELMTYSEADSDPASGRLAFRGNSQLVLLAPWPQGSQVCTRLVLQFSPLAPSTVAPALVPADSVGLPAALGLVAAIPPGNDFAVTLRMEAAYVLSGCTVWQPALALYDAAPTNPTHRAYSTYGTGFYYENTAPELGSIDDQYVGDGDSTATLLVAVDDVETGAAGVVLSVASSNTALVPEANITLGGTGATREVTVQTEPGKGGHADITLRGTDSSGASSETTFRVTITDAPTISAIDDILIQQAGSSGPIAFTIGDDLTAPDDLVVTATSSNQTLIPNANLVLTGSGAARSLSLSPFGSQYGHATITVTVEDGSGLTASESFLVRVNARPSLTSNNAPQVDQGATVVFTTANLNANDAESGPDRIRFTLAPGGAGTPGFNGRVLLAGVELGQDQSFTLQDIINGDVSFRHDDSCSLFGQFTFDIDDMDGGFGRAPLSPYLGAVEVVPRNDPPVAAAMALVVAWGGSVSDVLPGQDDDCVNDDPLEYSIVEGSGPTLGTITALDPATGAFTYTVNEGVFGSDQFSWRVSDGTHEATAMVSVTISNTAPVAVGDRISTGEGEPVTGQVQGSDADLPPQAIRFALVDAPQKGTITAFDEDTGVFTYEPAAHRIGEDSFTFVADDGIETSAPATFAIAIAPAQEDGAIAVSVFDDSVQEGAVVLLDPVSGDQWPLSVGGIFVDDDRPMGLDFQRNGDLVVQTDRGKVVRVSRADGTQTLLFDSDDNGVGLHVAPDGRVYAAVGPGGKLRQVDPESGGLSGEHANSILLAPSDADSLPDGRLVVTSAGAIAGGPNIVGALDWESGIVADLGVAGLEFPLSVAVVPGGLVAVGDGASFFGTPSAIRIIDPANGEEVATIEHAAQSDGTGLAWSDAGVLFSAARSTNSVLRHDLESGESEVFSANGQLISPWGVAVFNFRAAIFSDGFETPVQQP